LGAEIVEQLRERVVKSFMDVFILTQLTEIRMSGYDIISHLHRKYGILVSSGTVYSTLYSMERKGLIEAMQMKRKRVYTLTGKGEQSVRAVQKANGDIRNVLNNVLSVNSP
jgi:DNA-binding PadR family transcriptional regulator